MRSHRSKNYRGLDRQCQHRVLRFHARRENFVRCYHDSYVRSNIARQSLAMFDGHVYVLTIYRRNI